MARAIDGDELLDIERLLDTDVVRQSETASWLLDQVLYDIQAMPTLTQPNKPLTLEELRGMDGEPVWVKDVRHWALIDIGKGGRWDGVPFAIWVENGVRFYYNILARNLLCYRFPPKTEQEEGNMGRSTANKQVNGIVQSKNLP